MSAFSSSKAPSAPGPMGSPIPPGSPAGRESAASPGPAFPEREGAGGPRDWAEQLLEAFEPDPARWRETLELEKKLEASFRGLLEKLSAVNGSVVS
jgi:hypothetical protein